MSDWSQKIICVGFVVLAALQGLSAQTDTTFVATGNPLVKYKYTADPGAMVYDGKMYISIPVMTNVLLQPSIIC